MSDFAWSERAGLREQQRSVADYNPFVAIVCKIIWSLPAIGNQTADLRRAKAGLLRDAWNTNWPMSKYRL